MNRLETLCQLPGVSGDEKEVRDYLIQQYEMLQLNTVSDRLGSIFGKRAGHIDRSIMISSNMDESGLMIQDVNENGTLEFLVIGLYKKEELYQHKVTLLSRTHQRIQGIVVKQGKDLVIDIMASCAAEVEARDIRIGDFAILSSKSEMVSDHSILSKNLANRAGIELGLRILETNHEPKFNLVIGGISHSVVGQRGSITATTAVKPDIALVIDAVYIKDAQKDAVYIRNFDKSMLPNQMLKQHLYSAAHKAGLKPVAHMGELPSDGSFIHKSLNGTPTIVLVLPLMYDNSMINGMDMTVLDKMQKLINCFIEDLSESQIEEMQYSREARYEI